MTKTKILLVDDDENLTFLLNENLMTAGYEATICRDGESGLRSFRAELFQLCILDVMMPKMDGFTLAKQIRKQDHHIPVIFLTAKNMIDDKLKGFDLGADDYMTKPFSFHELLCRIKAVLSRTGVSENSYHWDSRMGNLIFNYNMRSLKNGSKEKKLSAKEAELLQVFQENKNRLISRQQILKRVWGDDDFFTSKSMDVYLTRIRKLIKDDPSLELLNVHGVGYKMIVNGEIEE
ncbi:MAG: response regulator transcription factor [Bacteroidia bacterium]